MEIIRIKAISVQSIEIGLTGTELGKSIKGKILFQDSSVGPGGEGEALLKFFDLSPTLRISKIFFVMGISWRLPE